MSECLFFIMVHILFLCFNLSACLSVVCQSVSLHSPCSSFPYLLLFVVFYLGFLSCLPGELLLSLFASTTCLIGTDGMLLHPQFISIVSAIPFYFPLLLRIAATMLLPIQPVFSQVRNCLPSGEVEWSKG